MEPGESRAGSASPFPFRLLIDMKEPVMVRILMTVALTLLSAGVSYGFGVKTGLKEGTPDLKSAGPMAFGPGGILFVGDTTGAAVFALQTTDAAGDAAKVKLNVRGIDKKIAALLGTTADGIRINDLAVNPTNGTAYLTVSRGRGPKALPVIVRVGTDGKLSEFSLKKVKFAKTTLENAPRPGGTGRRNRRVLSITDLAYINGRLIVAGLSNEEFASKLRVIAFPFAEGGKGASVEIFHGAHGRLETRSPVRTFVPFTIDGKPHVLAAYQCTPLVKFPLSQLKPGGKIRGTTVAELGNGNRPLDMIVYKKNGKNFLLLSNSRRGVMKINTEKIGSIEGISDKVPRGKTAGLTYKTIKGLTGVVQLDRLNAGHALLLVKTSGGFDLKTIELP